MRFPGLAHEGQQVHLLQTEMDARFLHMASLLSLLLWLITPSQLSTHTTSPLTGCLTDGRRVDSIRAGQPGESRGKVTEHQGRAVGVLLCTVTELVQVFMTAWQPLTFSTKHSRKSYLDKCGICIGNHLNNPQGKGTAQCCLLNYILSWVQ